MRGAAVRPIVVAAGGTGGHFYPAEALAAELLRRNQRVALMTDSRSGGLRSPVFEGREVFVLRGAGLAGRGVVRAAKGALALAAGTAQARGLLSRLNAAAVVGFGGYPCVPPVLAARTLPRARRPLVILHEQNAVLGRANRALSRYADQVALSFPQTSRVPPGAAWSVTGNPVRPGVLDARRPYAPPADRINLLVLGGSLGARVFSDLVPGALAALPDALRARLHLAQQCRAEDLARVRAAYDDAGIQAELSPFFPDVADRLAGAHLVLARAGASTVAELSAAGRPALLVPLPHAIDDHQAANAAALADAGGGWTARQADLTPALLGQRLAALLDDPDGLAQAAAASLAYARPDAAAALADLVLSRIAASTATGAVQGAPTTEYHP